MTRLSDAALAETVDLMEEEWSRIARTEGTLDPNEMRRSLMRARYHGKPVRMVTEELGLMRMQWILMGETLVPGYNC